MLAAALVGCSQQQKGGGFTIAFCGKAPLLTEGTIMSGYDVDLAARPYGMRVTWYANLRQEATVKLTSSCAQGVTYRFTDPRPVRVAAATTAQDGLPVAIAVQPAAAGTTALTVDRDGKQVAELRITVTGTLHQPSSAAS
jgi:hypothetical protein